MKENINYIGYEQVLTDDEILLCSQLIIKFKNKEIDFSNLRNLFLSYGIVIEVVPYDFSNEKITITKANDRKNRFLEKNYLYNDINYFILNSAKFNNVIFRIDYKAIEVLANHGVPEYQEILISILRKQLSILSFEKDPNGDLVIERNNTKRRITELKLKMLKKDYLNKFNK